VLLVLGGLAYLTGNFAQFPLTGVCGSSVPLLSGFSRPWGRIAAIVTSHCWGERSTMEGAGQRIGSRVEASPSSVCKGLSGAAVSAVRKDAGLTHGGFYKHFGTMDDLLLESLSEGFREIEDTLAHAAEQLPPGEAWKAIVKTYLSLELCEHPERGCPLAALAPDLARAHKSLKPQIVAELVNYKSLMVPFMPGRRPMGKERAFFAIFSTIDRGN
jgi:TetR/AcrR family transcriptional repressor of nem operon